MWIASNISLLLPHHSDFVLSQVTFLYDEIKLSNASEYSDFFLVQGKRPPQNCQQTHSCRVLEQNGSSSAWAAAQSWKLKMCRKAREGTSVLVVFKSKSEEEKMFLCSPSTGNIISLLYRCPSHPSGLHLSLPISSFSTSSISSSSSSSSQPRPGCDSN